MIVAVTTLSEWLLSLGGTAQRAIQSDLNDIRRFSEKRTDERWLQRLQQAWQALDADVSAAIAAPPVPDAESQYWWTKALVEFQRAAVDFLEGSKTLDTKMLLRSSDSLRGAVDYLTEAINRFQLPAH